MNGRPPATVGDLVRRAATRLRRRGVEDPRLDADLLLGHVLAAPRVALYRDPDRRVDRAAAARFQRMVRRRRSRVPTAYLLGERGFLDLVLEVGPGVLVPRPETELLVETALALVGDGAADPALGRVRPLRVLDVGCGSGNVALGIARGLPGARVVGVDVSAPALGYASSNVAKWDPGGRVRLLQLDAASLARAFRPGVFDLVVSNPPYVDRPPRGFGGELAHEPADALCGRSGPFPAIYDVLVGAASTLLAPGGALVVEVGQGQADVVRARFAAALEGIGARRDLAGIERVVYGFARGASPGGAGASLPLGDA